MEAHVLCHTGRLEKCRGSAIFWEGTCPLCIPVSMPGHHGRNAMTPPILCHLCFFRNVFSRAGID